MKYALIALPALVLAAGSLANPYRAPVVIDDAPRDTVYVVPDELREPRVVLDEFHVGRHFRVYLYGREVDELVFVMAPPTRPRRAAS